MAKHEVGILTSDRADDIWHARKLLEANRTKEVEVYTSVLTMAEAVAVEQQQKRVPEEAKSLLRRILSSGQFLTLVQMMPAIGMRAAELRWKHEIVLKGADAIHIASALELECVEFITTDERVRKLTTNPAIVSLAMRIIRAADTEILPDRSRQSDMLNETITESPPETDEN